MQVGCLDSLLYPSICDAEQSCDKKCVVRKCVISSKQILNGKKVVFDLPTTEIRSLTKCVGSVNEGLTGVKTTWERFR